jgi:hypothetical protein
MNNRWTHEEELKLIKSISEGKQFSVLSTEFGRTESALELRLKKIIYENIKAGKSSSLLARSMNIPEDKINQYYYSFAEYLEKHGPKITNPVQPQPSLIDNVETKILQSFKPNENTVNLVGGDAKKNKSERLLSKLENENKIMISVIENKNLREQINKMLKRGDIDKKTRKILKQMLSST